MKKPLIFTILLSMILVACSQDRSNYTTDSTTASEAKAYADESSTEDMEEYRNGNLKSHNNTNLTSEQKNETEFEAERKIIKTADYRFQVEDVEASTERIKDAVKGNAAYISSMNMGSSTYQISNNISIRVPAKNFELLLDELGRDAIYTNYRRVSARDVTEEFVDIESRLKTKREVRDRYISILRNKAKTVEDVLNAEEKIRVLQEEIESREGRLRFLKDRVGMSTINLDIYQKVEHTAQPDVYKRSYASKFLKSLQNGWRVSLNSETNRTGLILV